MPDTDFFALLELLLVGLKNSTCGEVGPVGPKEVYEYPKIVCNIFVCECV